MRCSGVLNVSLSDPTASCVTGAGILDLHLPLSRAAFRCRTGLNAPGFGGDFSHHDRCCSFKCCSWSCWQTAPSSTSLSRICRFCVNAFSFSLLATLCRDSSPSPFLLPSSSSFFFFFLPLRLCVQVALSERDDTVMQLLVDYMILAFGFSLGGFRVI